MKFMYVSIIIPAYNEEQSIIKVIDSAFQFADEVIVIDDGSIDKTAELAKTSGARVIQQEHLGYVAATKRGFKEATGDIIVTMDADGEHPAKDIPRLLEPLIQQDADIVFGVRTNIPRVSEKLINWLTNLKIKIGDACTGFRALKKELAIHLTLKSACTCGNIVLEADYLGAMIAEVSVDTLPIDKSRSASWHHIKQIFIVLYWLFKQNRREHLA